MDVSLIFGIIFTAIVMGLLIFFGFRYVSDMITINCDSQTAQQLVNLENAVKSTLSLSKDSVQEFKIIVQTNCAPQVCFVNPDVPIANPEGGWNPEEYATYLVTRDKFNVLVYGTGDKINGYTVDKFKPFVNFCLTSSRNVMLRNGGRNVEVTLPEF
jgi:hypothetical protein